ncbi:hypothetical protein AAG906_020264 [Vitis piasezkii]
MEEAKTMKTPMSSSIKLDEDEKGKSIDSTMYRGMIDSILTGRRIHMGYLMMMHMISCCESTTHVLPYDRFLTRVFKDVGNDHRTSLGIGTGASGVEEEAEIREMEGGLDPQKDFEQREPELDISQLQSKGVQFEAIFF